MICDRTRNRLGFLLFSRLNDVEEIFTAKNAKTRAVGFLMLRLESALVRPRRTRLNHSFWQRGRRTSPLSNEDQGEPKFSNPFLTYGVSRSVPGRGRTGLVRAVT